MQKAFTLSEAKIICKKYQYLVGTPFIKDDNRYSMVEEVVVAPYEANDQWQFIDNYKESNDPFKAISFYRKPYYDVLVIATFNAAEKIFRDIRAFLQNNLVA